MAVVIDSSRSDMISSPFLLLSLSAPRSTVVESEESNKVGECTLHSSDGDKSVLGGGGVHSLSSVVLSTGRKSDSREKG